jgi:hypothetical protein
MARAVPYLPPAVHVAVVDPGVGTDRRAIVIAAGTSLLAGPDNGLLLPAADALGGVAAAHALTNETLWRAPVSKTFHGRDVFAPVAAHLAAGLPLADVGDPVDPASLIRLPEPVQGEVTDVDRFGNVAVAGYLGAFGAGDAVVVNGRRAVVAETYAVVEPGELLVYPDSDGATAVAVRDGSAAERLGGVGVGDMIDIRKDG